MNACLGRDGSRPRINRQASGIGTDCQLSSQPGLHRNWVTKDKSARCSPFCSPEQRAWEMLCLYKEPHCLPSEF